MSKCASADFETRIRLLSENFSIINDVITTGKPEKYNYFLYYRGLTRLGMHDIENARADFNACLETSPGFEPALMILKGLDNAEEAPRCNGNCVGCDSDCESRK